MYISNVTLFQAISGFKNPSHESGWTDMISQLATLDELGDVINLNLSIWV